MQIVIETSSAELEEMGVTKDQLSSLVIQQLDDATLSDHRPAIELCGYGVTVNVMDR